MENMRPSETEPAQRDIEALVTDEERRALAQPDVPEEVKSEISERLERFAEEDAAQYEREDAGNQP